MKDTKQKADELVEQFRPLAKTWDCYWDVPSEDKNEIKCAILSTKKTIEVLQNRKQNQNFVIHIILNEAIDEQTEILKELESRL